MSSATADVPLPYALVAELTYRCPLRCAYCSNPVERAGARGELDTRSWCSAIEQASELGVLQVHLSGGEPLLRADLEALVRCARGAGLYSNLITSAVPLTPERLARLVACGLDAIQISLQGLDAASAARIGGGDWLSQKLAAARWAREHGLPLTLNVVLHRENLQQVEALIELAESLGAHRLELANVQVLGWALENRDRLLSDEEQLTHARAVAGLAQQRLSGRMEILFVLPDYFAGKPRACMGGWARRVLVLTPDGLVLPCHQATSIPGLRFERVTDRALADIWHHSEGLRRFRGDGALDEPCRSCEKRHTDFGGCRCQAFALTGNAAAADPACRLSPDHGLVQQALSAAREARPVPLRLRRPPESPAPARQLLGRQVDGPQPSEGAQAESFGAHDGLQVTGPHEAV
jgi:PqqA peptide cyclase